MCKKKFNQKGWIFFLKILNKVENNLIYAKAAQVYYGNQNPIHKSICWELSIVGGSWHKPY
jgi:hypothetical protein